MAFTFIAAASNFADALGTTLDCSSSLNVAAGDVLWAWATHESGATTFAVAKDSGSPANTFTFDAGDEVNHTDGILGGAMGYVLSAAADSAATFRLTTGSKDFRRILILQFRPDAGATVTKDASALSATNANGNPAVTGDISTTGTDEVCCGGYGNDTGLTLTTEQVNSVAATEPSGSPVPSPNGAAAFYRILTATFTNGHASGDQGGSPNNYVMGIMAFKSVAGGGVGAKLSSPTRAGKGLGIGPQGRRMMPQQYPVAPPLAIEVSQLRDDPARGGKIGFGGPRGRRLFPQRYPEASSLTLYTMPATAGVYVLSNIAIGLQHNDDLVSAVGTYVLSGAAANLLRGYRLIGNTGTYSISGAAINLLHGSVLNAVKGTYLLSSNAANVLVGRVLSVVSGAYNISGAPAGTLHNSVLVAIRGQYNITGSDATLIYSGAGAPPAGHQYIIALKYSGQLMNK